MIGGIRVIEIGPTPRAIKSELGRATIAALRQIGALWHSRFRPKHFTHAGAKEYGYTRRRGEDSTFGSKSFWGSYTGRKFNRYRHTLPLVYSGLSRRLTAVRDIRATRKRVRIVMPAPALNLRPRNGRIRMREEMTRVSRREADFLTETFEGRINREFNAIKSVRTLKLL